MASEKIDSMASKSDLEVLLALREELLWKIGHSVGRELSQSLKDLEVLDRILADRI